MEDSPWPLTPIPSPSRPPQNGSETLFCGGWRFFCAFPLSRLATLFPRARRLGGDQVIAGKVDELKPNSAKIFRFGSRPGLLIRNSDGNYRALPPRVPISVAPSNTAATCRRSGVPARTGCTI